MTTPVAGSTSQPGDHDRRPAGAPDASGEFVAYDQFIDNQLHTARRQVRTVDIAVSLTTLGAGTLGFFLLAVLCDHWLLSGGLGTVGRWLALVIYLAGALTYCWHSLLPLCIRRINPVYAAYTIERSKPTLKNSLINFLLLRAKPAGLAPHVYEAIEQHAATELAQVPLESTVDRSKLIKIGYVFLGLVLVAAIYKVSSPKDPFQTFGRIVLPWADIAPPTRVTIVEVRPGNSTVMRGQRAKISAQVHGIAGEQTVRLVYSTDDGQIVDRPVPMQVPTEGYLFECDLPEGKGGIQQDVNYRVVAGDATSNEFRLTVQAAPTIVVESVDYVYPGYTGMVSQTVDHQGDLKAIEGTQVTLHALANQPIKSAAIDFDSNGSEDQRMTFEDRHATATVTLALKADRQTPEHSNYQLRFTNVDGKENPQPIRHQIEVARDVSPEIQFLAPKRDEIELPLNGTLRCEVSAHDPDFALARVALVGQSVGGQPFERPLLEEPSKTGQPWQGQFHKKLLLVPQKLGLKVGDVLEYWAWAEDTKTPVANRSETTHRRARIVSPTKSDGSPDALARGDQQSEDKSDHDSSADDKQPGDKPDSPGDDTAPDDPATPPKAGSDPAHPQNPLRDGARPPNSDPQADQQPEKADSMQDRPPGKPDRDPTDQAPDKQEQAGNDRSDEEPSEKDQSGDGQSGKGESGKGQSGKSKAGKSQSGKDSAGQAGSEQGESADSSSDNDSQTGEGQGGKTGTRGKPGSNKSQGGKRQPVAKDGTQDGDAFDEIMERQNEHQQGDSATGTRQTTTRRSSTPPAHGTPNEQTGEQKAKEQGNGEKRTEGKQSGKENADKKNTAAGDAEKKGDAGKKSGDNQGADKTAADKEAGDKTERDKKPDDRAGNDTDGKSSGGEEMQPKHPTQGKNDPAGRSDGKMPAANSPKDSADGSTDGQASADGKEAADGMSTPDGKQAANGKPSTDGKPAPGGKPTDGSRTPDKKSVTQTGDGEEKNSSNGEGQTASEPSGQTKSGQPGTGKQTPDNKSMDKQTADKQSPNGQTEEPSAAGESPTGAKPDKTPTPQKKGGDGAKSQDGNQGESRGDDQPGEPKAGRGAQPPGKPGQTSTQKPTSNDQPKGNSGDAQKDQGNSGAGKGGADDQQASPQPQGENRPTKKSPGQGTKPDGDREKSATPSSPSTSDHQSNSEGKQDGDRSGGGKQGGGQKSQQAGPGGPGTHSPADEGGQAAPDQEGKESSDQPGDDRAADKPTGQNGPAAGPGSKAGSPPSAARSKPADRDGKGSDKPADGKRDGSDKPAEDAQSGKNPSGNRGKAGPGQGGGNAADNGPVEPPPVAAEQADEANLDFARKATELTIQRLRDQLAKGQVDQELLDRLQWSQQDMENWVRRWEEMFRRSEQQGKAGQAARMELDATLRSLGLRPHGTVVSGHRQDDATRGLKEGRRTQPPAEYRDQVRQYLQGVSRTQNGATTGRGTPAPRQTAPSGTGSEK